uniref:SAM domain-containing protein n=1 Tax=Parascaris univalens TaxID=6257 RepID=A0A915BDD8_PARUN
VTGECKDALDVRVLFMKEADRYYRKAGRKGRIIHLIEGFEIEESDEPFICDPPLRVDDWIPVEIIDKIRLSKSPESPSKPSSTNNDAQSPNEKKGKVETPPKGSKDISKKQRNKTPVSKDENRDSRSSSEKKKRKRKTNERLSNRLMF